jgi:hypothetical protein
MDYLQEISKEMGEEEWLKVLFLFLFLHRQ